MISTSIALAASLLTLASAQTPPGYNVSASTNLPISFNGQEISAGQRIPLAENREAPTLFLPDSLPSDATYLLVMADPDVPSPLFPQSRAEILHWMQPSLRAGDNGELSSDEDPVVPFAAPQPPSVDAHRYILMLYTQQGDSFEVPEAYAEYDDENRTSFSALAFQEAAGLGSPAAATYFLSGCEEDCMYDGPMNGTTNGTAPGNGTSGGGSGGSGGGSSPNVPPSPSSSAPASGETGATGEASQYMAGWSAILGAVGVMFAALV